MAPIVHRLEKDYSDDIEFVYLDVLDSTTNILKDSIGYRSYPSFFLLDGDGNVIARWVGKVEDAEFIKVFDDVLLNN
tara:strand:+ start:2478 stop:2708 length:231 start_codon:yes stop_codon:yes gene_type:complete